MPRAVAPGPRCSDSRGRPREWVGMGGGNGWEWVGMGGNGWKWEGLGGNGWNWVVGMGRKGGKGLPQRSQRPLASTRELVEPPARGLPQLECILAPVRLLFCFLHSADQPDCKGGVGVCSFHPHSSVALQPRPDCHICRRSHTCPVIRFDPALHGNHPQSSRRVLERSRIGL